MLALFLAILLADAPDPVVDPVARMVKLISTERISTAHRQLTARPHIAGTAGGREHAQTLSKLLIGYGVKIQMQSYWALLSYPRRMSLRLFRAPQKNLGIALALNERSDSRDPATGDADLLPGYIAYSASGRVRGKAIDAGDGLAADYDVLEKAGVATEGTVAVMRFGKASIGDQVALAVKHGVSGVVFYREPAKVRAWPLGPGRASWFVERGAAASLDFPLQIPLATVSSQVVEQIFASRKKGALGSAGLNLGVELELDIQMADSPRPIFNIIATIDGSEKPEHAVMLSAHHDAWGFGGADPGSAESALLELARVLGVMSKEGWRPRHTIQLAFFDGGEFGGLGASEHEKEFKQTADFPVPDQEAFFGAYHSNYDTADYMTRWRDPAFRATRSLTETLGRAALRLATADIPTRPAVPAVPPPDSPARGEIDYAEAKVAKARQAFAEGVIAKVELDRATKALAEAQERYERLREGSGQLTPAIAADEVRKAENHARVMRLNVEVLKASFDNGMVSRRDMEQAEALAKDADDYLVLARTREQELTHEWELIRKVQEFEARGGRFDDSVLERISLDYEKQFGHPLPVSAMGMTHTHELMNFDHTGRVDVALSPDSVEGKWLTEQLTLRDVPFLVFRSAVPGKATGAHIHLGLPSPRLHK